MFVTAGSPQALVKVIEAPRLYDPRKPQESGNRLLDKSHLAGIVRYLEEEEDFVIGATTLYVRPGVVHFEPIDSTHSERPILLGYITLPIDARFTIGDGQHRLRAYEDVLIRHGEDDHDPVLNRIRRSGTPAIIVEEDDAAKTAQDFVDLQRNVKPLSSSLGASLDRRWGINRLAMDLAKGVTLLNDVVPGDRVEYLSQTLSKLSPKMYTFASWRFAAGTLLIGFGQRSRIKWEQEAEKELGSRFAERGQFLTLLLNYAAEQLPGWRDVGAGAMPVPTFREQYVLGTAAGLNAFAGAAHELLKSGSDWRVAIDTMAAIDWRKSSGNGSDVFFEGTVLQKGKVVSSRTAFEPAARKLLEAVEKTRQMTQRAAVDARA